MPFQFECQRRFEYQRQFHGPCLKPCFTRGVDHNGREAALSFQQAVDDESPDWKNGGKIAVVK
jgi:hypothetical protein